MTVEQSNKEFSILDYSLQQIEDFIRGRMLNKKSLMHFHVCTELKEKEKQEIVAERFNISPRQVRKIKRCKCPKEGILPGYRK